MQLDDCMDKEKDNQVNVEESLQNEKDNNQCQDNNQKQSKLFWGHKFPKTLSKQQIFQLKTNQITFNQNQFQQHLSIIVIDKDANSQVVRLAVSCSYFMVELTVLNLTQDSISHDFKLLGFGAFSKIYMYQTTNGHMAIKSLDFIETKQVNDQMEKTLKKGILQFSICKIFSVLQVAPKINKLFGFDILIFQNKIQFSMEICKEININTAKSLQNQLLLIHSLGFVHGDIKPENIMWSQTYSKNVFVDFGLSRIMKEQIGQKVLTCFFGTYGYCCQQMKKLFVDTKLGYVDLFYNDIFALSKVLSIIAKNFRNPTNLIEGKQVDLRKNRNFFENILLKSIIFEQDIKRLNEFILEHPFIMIEQTTIELVLSLNNSLAQKKIKEILSLKLFVNFDKQKHDYFENDEMKMIVFNREKRIKGLCEDFNGTINDLMLFMMIYFNVDVTPYSIKRSNQLKEFLSNSTIQTSNYWLNFIEYINNCSVTRQQILEIFQVVKKKLGMIDWPKCDLEEVKVYGRARQIAMKVWESKINLFQIQGRLNENELGEMKDLKIENCFNLNNYKQFPFVKFIVRYRKQLLLNSGFNNPIAQKQMFQKCLADINDKFNIKQIPLPILLIQKKIQLDISEKSGQYLQLLSNFLAYFKNFGLAQKHYYFIFRRRHLLLDNKTSRDAESYYDLSIEQLRNTNSCYFTFRQAMHMYFYQAMKGKWNDLTKIQLFIDKDLLKIADFAFSFEANFTTERFFETFYFLHFTIYSKHVILSGQTQTFGFQLQQIFVCILNKCWDKLTYKSHYNILQCLFILQLDQKSNKSVINKLIHQSFDQFTQQIQTADEFIILTYLNLRMCRLENQQQSILVQLAHINKFVNIIRQTRPDLMMSAQFFILYSFQIKFMIHGNQNPKQEVNNFFKLLCDQNLILKKVDCLQKAFKNISYYFKIYPDDIMNKFLMIVKIAGKQELKSINFVFEQSFENLFFHYFFYGEQTQKIKINIEGAFKIIEAKFNDNSQYFTQNYSNSIYVFEQIFFLYFCGRLDQFNSEIITKCLYITSFLRNLTTFYLIRRYHLTVPFWKMLLIEKGIIYCSKRSTKIAHAKCFRNCQYHCPHQKCFFQFDGTQINAKNSKIEDKISKVMILRWNQIHLNKKKGFKGDFVNMSSQRKSFYLFKLNKKRPFQIYFL